jgi:predicted unusual protein kinase regulating ubiquinone biosynthesis (AarF/ABC1/UbiB family)
MSLFPKPEKLKRYKDLALFLLKHANEGITSYKSSEIPIEDESDKDINGDPQKFAKDLEELGPTFIKLGQLLSTRPDFLPISYIEELTKLQDQIEPFSFKEVEEIVENEIGTRISKAFQEFSSEPIAAASLGQVHKALLRDGRPVAVKVQRPGIRRTILTDLETLEEIAATVDKHTSIGRQYAFQDVLQQFKQTILVELDYRQEAQNLIKLGNNLNNYENILIPQPINDYSTSRILTMDYIRGKKVTKLSPLARLEMDGGALAEDLFKAYLDQVLVDGFFHADPHPGNVFITDDHKIALIDLGMVAHIDPQMRENLMKLLLYISEGRGQEATQVSIKIGTKLENYDEDG